MNISMFHPSSTSPYKVELEFDNLYVNYRKLPTLCNSRGPVTDSNFSRSGLPHTSVDCCPQCKGVVQCHNLEMFPLVLILILDMLHSTTSLSISVFPNTEVWEGDNITLECEAEGERTV